jgi:hypothetical protein
MFILQHLFAQLQYHLTLQDNNNRRTRELENTNGKPAATKNQKETVKRAQKAKKTPAKSPAKTPTKRGAGNTPAKLATASSSSSEDHVSASTSSGSNSAEKRTSVVRVLDFGGPAAKKPKMVTNVINWNPRVALRRLFFPKIALDAAGVMLDAPALDIHSDEEIDTEAPTRPNSPDLSQSLLGHYSVVSFSATPYSAFPACI